MEYQEEFNIMKNHTHDMKLVWDVFRRLTMDERNSGEKSSGCPKENGVYVISELINDMKVPRYVGKGKIHERISAHKNDSEENEELKDLMQNRSSKYRIHCAVVPNETDRTNIEYTLFKYYDQMQTLYNKTVPEGVDIVVERPF